MARSIRNAKLDSRSARSKLAQNKAGYWVVMAKGCGLGYRKGSKGGRWIARVTKPAERRKLDSGEWQEIQPRELREITLGEADDHIDADGTKILSYAQAQEAARSWFAAPVPTAVAEPEAPYTVNRAADDYLKVYQAGQTRGGGKGNAETLATIDAFIRPALGAKLVAELTVETIADWHRDLAAKPPRKRSRMGKAVAYQDVDMADPDVIRQRRASANRILTVLKAILNRVPAKKRGGAEKPWDDVKPFREVDAPTVRWLENAEAIRLQNAAPDDLRRLITGALLTGCRYSELGRLKVVDFSQAAGGIHVRLSKGGKPRFIHLTDEGLRFFVAQTVGKASNGLIFTRANGSAWQKSDQHRPITDACTAAKIIPAIGFHILRHTYGSWLATKGVPMGVIAAQLGHADTRMTERHYAHLSPSYVADTVRNASGELGLAPVQDTNVVGFPGGVASAAVLTAVAKLPSDDEILELKRSLSNVAIAQMYGVSEAAVRKRVLRATAPAAAS